MCTISLHHHITLDYATGKQLTIMLVCVGQQHDFTLIKKGLSHTLRWSSEERRDATFVYKRTRKINSIKLLYALRFS